MIILCSDLHGKTARITNTRNLLNMVHVKFKVERQTLFLEFRCLVRSLNKTLTHLKWEGDLHTFKSKNWWYERLTYVWSRFRF